MYDALEMGALKENTTAAAECPRSLETPPQKTIGKEAKKRRRWLGQYFFLPFRLNRRLLLGIGLLLFFLLPGGALLGRYCWALRQFRIGRTLLERYHQDEARPYLEAYLRLCPNNAQALLLLARAARRAGAVAKGDEYLEHYQRVHGQTEELVREQIFQTAVRGDVDKVRKYCQKLVRENDPAAPLALEAMVHGYFRLFRIKEGRAVLQTWLERQPNNTQALLYQAGVWTLLLHHSKAVATYERLLELDPEHDAARLKLALVLMEDRIYTTAVPHLESVVRRQPNNLAAAVQLARCRDFLGQEAEAERLLEGVLRREPHFSHALSEQGRIAMRQGQGDRAEACLREALVQEPGNHELLYQLILCLERNGKTEEAESKRQRLDQLKADLKRLEEIATTELPIRPHDLDLQYEFALMLLKTGRDEEGVQWLHRVLHAKPSHAPSRRALVEFYRQIGDEEQAAYHRRFLPTANPRYTIEPSVLHPTIQPMPRIGPLPQPEPRP